MESRDILLHFQWPLCWHLGNVKEETAWFRGKQCKRQIRGLPVENQQAELEVGTCGVKTETYRDSGLAGQEYCCEAIRENDNWQRLKIQKNTGAVGWTGECKMVGETAQETEAQKKETDREVVMNKGDVRRMQSQERHWA